LSLYWAHEFLRGVNVLIKTFLFGILLGIAVAAGALYALPVVDQHREVSLVTVAPNGGNLESFHINIPMDRIMVGTAEEKPGVPDGLDWPQDTVLAGVSAELFKIRNARDVVIGVASRAVAKEEESDIIEWVLHLPARGTLFVSMEPDVQEDGYRIGRLRAGSSEFARLRGFVAEGWVTNTSGEEDAPVGRIELLATYVGTAELLE
jgi:hypothetical protein